MAKTTLEARLIAGLKAEGLFENDSERSGKYRSFFRLGSNTKYFVGRNGALRVGLIASNSRSLDGTGAYARVLAAGDKVLNVTSSGTVDTDALLRKLGGNNA